MSVYIPTSKQQETHSRPEQFLLFGGALGGGKTAWLCNEAIYHCLAFPGSRIYLARHQLSSFKKTTLLTLLDFLPFELITEHNKSDNYFTFNNGSRIYYGGLGDDLKAIEELKSMELSAYGVDQAEETTENFFHMLNSRLRLTPSPFFEDPDFPVIEEDFCRIIKRIKVNVQILYKNIISFYYSKKKVPNFKESSEELVEGDYKFILPAIEYYAF